MATINFAGIGSGFDSNALINGLVAAEKTPETALKQHQSDLTTQISTLGTLVSQMQALGTAASALSTAQGVQSIGASTSDQTVVTASASAAALSASYQIKVSSLATAQTSVSTGYATDTAGVAGTGSVTITAGAGQPFTVSYGASDTLDTIASAINQQAGSSLTASVVFDGTKYHLMIAGSSTGQANAISFSETGSGLGLAQPGATVTAAADASFSVNGLALTRPTNSVSDVIGGVTFNLQGATAAGGAATRITVAPDTSTLQKKAQTLIDAYNAVAQTLHAQLTYSGVKLASNTLFGDTTLQGLQQALGGMMASAVTYTGGSLAAGTVGISLQSNDQLALDATKFTQALTADPLAMQHLLIGNGSGGLTKAISNLVAQYTQYGTGALVTAQSSKHTQISNYDDSIARIESRAASLDQTLRAQFAHLDGVMNALTNQQSYVTALFFNSSSSSNGK